MPWVYVKKVVREGEEKDERIGREKVFEEILQRNRKERGERRKINV